MTTATQIWVCKKCGHRWANRKQRKPFVCPKCHSYLWDSEKEIA